MGASPNGRVISPPGSSRSLTAPSSARCSRTPSPCHQTMASSVSSAVTPCGVRCCWRCARRTYGAWLPAHPPAK
eukprot:2887485-Alexandrium_andersonii.AAC.1